MMDAVEAARVLTLVQATPIGQDARCVEIAPGQFEIHYAVAVDGMYFYRIRSQAEYEAKLQRGWLHNQWLEALSGEVRPDLWWW